MKLKLVGSVVEWLKRWDCDRFCLVSKPTRVILLSLGKTLYGTFPCLVVLKSNSKF